MKNCDYCEKPFTSKSVGCKNENQHKTADYADRIAYQIQADLSDRSGLDFWGTLDEEVTESILETWAEIVRKEVQQKS
ncbi:MAG: hypothetical protein LUM44_17680 [Pyrinomonadaceae bacterium]|nr:hypothetical protein [Pyrinomonadaceae bacterium]